MEGLCACKGQESRQLDLFWNSNKAVHPYYVHQTPRFIDSRERPWAPRGTALLQRPHDERGSIFAPDPHPRSTGDGLNGFCRILKCWGIRGTDHDDLNFGERNLTIAMGWRSSQFKPPFYLVSNPNRHLNFNFLPLVCILGDVDCAHD